MGGLVAPDAAEEALSREVSRRHDDEQTHMPGTGTDRMWFSKGEMPRRSISPIVSPTLPCSIVGAPTARSVTLGEDRLPHFDAARCRDREAPDNRPRPTALRGRDGLSAKLADSSRLTTWRLPPRNAVGFGLEVSVPARSGPPDSFLRRPFQTGSSRPGCSGRHPQATGQRHSLMGTGRGEAAVRPTGDAERVGRSWKGELRGIFVIR
jgi:hypothetical protein